MIPAYDLGSKFTRQAVRRRVYAAMKAQIVILRGELGVMDPDTLLVGGLSGAKQIYPQPGYPGMARIRTVTRQGAVETSGGLIPLRETIISIPMEAPVPHVDDAVIIGVDDLADANLDTRIFQVLAVDGGSFFGDARRMTVQGWYESRYWGTQ
jgi:hypothetical protein